MTEPHEHMVLLVDDHEEARDAPRHAARNEGFAVGARRATGQEALDALLRRPRPCPVVLDLMMPGMDGWSSAGGSLLPLFARIPTVVLSGHAQTSPRRRRA